MFFSSLIHGFVRPGRHQKAVLLASLFVIGFFCPFSSATETVDSIAALVNEDVITFSDLVIVEALGLFEVRSSSLSDVYLQILDRMINQKLVIGLTRDLIPIGPQEVDLVIAEIIKRKGRGELETILNRFGMEEEDAREYIREKILYERIIGERFGLAVVVRLAEIEDHYKNVYVPQKESMGLETKPLLDVLSEIETAIRKEKIDDRVGEWLSGLKREADIQVLFQRREKE